jgi:hypothetical protein
MKLSEKTNRWFSHRSIRKTVKLRRSVDATFEAMEKRVLMTSLAVWNFNDSSPTTANLFAVDRTASGVTATMSSNFTAAGLSNFGGTTVNADSGDTAGNALALLPGTSNVNNGKMLTFTAGTTNYSNIVVSFATQATSTGFNSDQFQYSTDGTNFTSFGSPYAPPSAFAGTGGVQSFNLSSITGLNNDPNASFRIIFNGGTSASGNNRIDNLIIAGTTLAPIVTSVSPNSGDGTAPITITGSNFTGATQVSFGSIAVQSTGWAGNTSTSISVLPPSGLTLNTPVDVTVTGTFGTSATIGTAGQFTLTPVVSGSPTVSGLSINSGPAIGGESVTITGTNFTGATNVSFGTTAASFSVTDSSHIVATEPAGIASPTPVDVTVVTGSGTSPTNTSDQFYYNAPTGSVAVTSSDTGIATSRTVIGNFNAENGTYAISSVHFYIDSDKSGTLTAGDTDLGLGTANGSGFVVNFVPSQYNVGFGTQTLIAVATSTSTAQLTKLQTFTVASPQFQFNPTNYITNASAGTVTLTVTRTFDTTEAAQVSYNTSDGSAIAGTDYNAASGTLLFPADPGATGNTDSQTITIPIRPTANPAGSSKFTITLSNPIGSNTSQGNLQITMPASTATANVSIQQLTAKAFTPGDVVVYRVGDGSAALSSASTVVYLEEYSPTGTLVQSFPLQSTAGGASGTNQPLTAAGTAAEGFLSVTEDGHYLLVPGYDTVAGTAGVAGTSSTTVNREVGILGADGTINTTNTFANWTNSGNPRSVASVDGKTLYLGGSDSGIFYVVTNNTAGQTASSISTAAGSIRTINITNNNLYASTGSGSLRITQVGSGLATTSGQPMVNLPGISNNSSGGNTAVPSPYAFFLTSNSGSTLDTLYIADDTSSTGGIDKFSLVSGTWMLNNVITAANVRGITGIQSGGTVTLYISSGGTGSTGGGTLYSLVDSSGYDANINGSLTTLATAPTDEAYRGVAFVPIPFVTPVLTSIDTASGPDTGGTAVTITGANFSGGSVVRFGSTNASSVTYVSSTQLIAIAPPETAGQVDITVVTPGGTTATLPADQYTYISTFPTWVTTSGGATWNASSNTLTVTGAATINANPTTATAPNIVVTGGTLSINPTVTTVKEIDLGSLNISSGTVTLATHSTPMVLAIQNSNGLMIGSGTLDLANGYLDVAGGNLGTITGLINSGRSGGLWTGAGITSSTAAADAAGGNYLTGLGVMLNQNSSGGQLYATFDGATAHAADVLVRYTYIGDANLDGTVSSPDYTLIDAAWLTEQSTSSISGWHNGDFNFDRVVNGSDYTLIDNAFNTQGTPLAGATAQIAAAGAMPTAVITTATSTDGFFSDKKVKPSIISDLEDLITAG